MTDTPAPPPASVLAAAREAVELAAKATPGPWRWHDRDGIPSDRGGFQPSHIVGAHLGGVLGCDHRGPSDRDADLIAHAGTHYGAIAAALLAAQEREAQLRAEVLRWKALAVRAALNPIALTMDTPSQKWIAPEIWTEMLAIREEVTAALLAAHEREAGRLWVVVDAGCWACEGDGPEIVGVFTDQAVAEGHAERLFQAQDELGLHRHQFFACEAPRLNHIQPWHDTPENAEGTPDA